MTLKHCRPSPLRLPVASPGRCEIKVAHRFMDAGAAPPRDPDTPDHHTVYRVSAAPGLATGVHQRRAGRPRTRLRVRRSADSCTRPLTWNPCRARRRGKSGRSRFGQPSGPGHVHAVVRGAQLKPAAV